jgi:hypothetical protein
MADTTRRAFLRGAAAAALLASAPLGQVAELAFEPLVPAAAAGRLPLFYFNINQRALLHWHAVPGDEICTPTGRVCTIDVMFRNPLDEGALIEVFQEPDGEISVHAPPNALINVFTIPSDGSGAVLDRIEGSKVVERLPLEASDG